MRQGGTEPPGTLSPFYTELPRGSSLRIMLENQHRESRRFRKGRAELNGVLYGRVIKIRNFGFLRPLRKPQQRTR